MYNNNSSSVDFFICVMIDFSPGIGITNPPRIVQKHLQINYDVTDNCWCCPQSYTGEDEQSINYHLGCQAIHLPAHTGKFIAKGNIILPSRVRIDDASGNPDGYVNVSYGDNSTSYHYTNMYVDVFNGTSDWCASNTSACTSYGASYTTGCENDIIGNQIDLSPDALHNFQNHVKSLGCPAAILPGWNKASIILPPGNANTPAICTFDVGNFITMHTMGNFDSRLRGTLFNAPTGSNFKIIYPKDTIGTDSTIAYDSSSYTVSGSGCTGNAVSVNIPFMITPYMGAQMKCYIQLPNNSCGNVLSNGFRVSFQGIVTAKDSSAYYNIGDTMYTVSGEFIRDTTSPVIDSIHAEKLNDSTIRIYTTSHEDTSTIVGGMISYNVGGGGTKWIATTPRDTAPSIRATFDDTIVYESGFHGSITYQIMVTNEVGLMDSTGVDTLLVFYDRKNKRNNNAQIKFGDVRNNSFEHNQSESSVEDEKLYKNVLFEKVR